MNPNTTTTSHPDSGAPRTTSPSRHITISTDPHPQSSTPQQPLGRRRSSPRLSRNVSSASSTMFGGTASGRPSVSNNNPRSSSPTRIAPASETTTPITRTSFHLIRHVSDGYGSVPAEEADDDEHEQFDERSRLSPSIPVVADEDARGGGDHADASSDVVTVNLKWKPGVGRDAESTGAWFKRFLKFVGPGFMIGVGYLDPGNWASDLQSGSSFGYSLVYVIFIANIMAMVLQYLCIKLGVVTGRDLAMACRRHFSMPVNIAFFFLCELAIIATDLAEVIGVAIALGLLFKIPLAVGVALTGFDVLLVLFFWGAKHLRMFETVVMVLVVAVAGCFLYLLVLSNPDWVGVAWGLVPTGKIFTENGMLYMAMAITGATIMPHNLYLHSSIVRFRSNVNSEEIGEIQELPDPMDALHPSEPGYILEDEPQPLRRKETIPQTLFFTNMDSAVALTGALFINCAILIVSAASFNQDGDVADLKDAYTLLKNRLGPGAGVAFAFALLLSGQSSTITCTLAGQIVTEGFLGPSYKFSPWIQRLSTRLLAIIPAMFVVLLYGEEGMNGLLVGSQVILSLQLPFAVWPLVWITSCEDKMRVKFEDPDDEEGDGGIVDEVTYANGTWLKASAYFVAVILTVFNIILIIQVIRGEG
ncbi:hypothetical protein HDV05_004622 [Chytridiales sp. JEL 0842]|nr:hypothetical protein HDV05_004622 [Chytridiales sp. JEL 0842]